MKIVLTGATGFLGEALVAQLAAAGHELVRLTRGTARQDAIGRVVAWQPDGTAASSWTSDIDGAGAIINLAGANLADKRWTAARKTLLRDSRILATRSLVSAMRASAAPPPLFISGSAVGYYGDTGEQIVDESFPPGSGFLATLCVDWEAEAHAAEAFGCRVVTVRTGVVLGPGGALEKMTTAFRLFAGGPMGSGKQYMSWIHRADWASLVTWLLQQPDIAGPVNATAPSPVTNETLAGALGAALHRPSWFRTPAVALRAAVGELADALLTGQRVMPKRALDHGFTFTFANITEAMRDATR